jgi:bacterial/archaeal transporter family protein
MTAKWLIPTLGYILVLGSLGVTSKLALRTLSWQDLLLWTTVGYIITSIFLLALNQADFHWESNVWWAILSAVLAISALILLYVALGTGEASKVIPVSAAYPAVTLILSAITLSEHVSLARVGGVLLVVAGVVVLTSVH